MRVYHKAYVYLTCGTDLLVFDEPDTPHLGLQVPGGTQLVDAQLQTPGGTQVLSAASRDPIF